MAICLMALSHYLNQYWLFISEVLWDSSENNFPVNATATILYYEFKSYTSKITATSSRGQRVKCLIAASPHCGSLHAEGPVFADALSCRLPRYYQSTLHAVHIDCHVDHDCLLQKSNGNLPWWPGGHFTKGLCVHDWNLILLSVILILVIQSGHNFVHVTTAELLQLVQHFDLIGCFGSWYFPLKHVKTTFLRYLDCELI